MTKYIKKEPDTYEIIQWTGNNLDEVREAMPSCSVRRGIGECGEYLSMLTDGGTRMLFEGTYISIDSDGLFAGTHEDLSEFTLPFVPPLDTIIDEILEIYPIKKWARRTYQQRELFSGLGANMGDFWKASYANKFLEQELANRGHIITKEG